MSSNEFDSLFSINCGHVISPLSLYTAARKREIRGEGGASISPSRSSSSPSLPLQLFNSQPPDFAYTHRFSRSRIAHVNLLISEHYQFLHVFSSARDPHHGFVTPDHDHVPAKHIGMNVAYRLLRIHLFIITLTGEYVPVTGAISGIFIVH